MNKQRSRVSQRVLVTTLERTTATRNLASAFLSLCIPFWILVGIPSLAHALSSPLGLAGGTVSFNWSTETVSIQNNQITNASSTYTSGTLDLELWLSASQYTGGNFSGWKIASARMPVACGNNSILAPNSSCKFDTGSIPLSGLPAPGTYYATVFLDEYQTGCSTNGGFCIAAWQPVNTNITVPSAMPPPMGGGGGGAVDLPALAVMLAAVVAVGFMRRFRVTQEPPGEHRFPNDRTARALIIGLSLLLSTRLVACASSQASRESFRARVSDMKSRCDSDSKADCQMLQQAASACTSGL